MRKIPRQARSRALVDRLVEATGSVIAARGLEFTTTNHIAAEAGVDIASLYQYFANKEELIEAWLEHLANQQIKLAETYLSGIDLAMATPRDIAHGALTLGLSALRADPVVMELARHWMHLSIHRPMMILEQELLRVAAIYFRQHFHRYPIEDLHIRLYVLANSTMATVGRHLSEDRPVIRDEQLIDTLVTMIVLMLTDATDVSAQVLAAE